MTAHNHHAVSLSFQSSFRNHEWGQEEVGDARGEKNKNSLRAPQGEAALAGFRSQAPSQQPRCSGALQWPFGAPHTALKVGEETST